MVRRPADEARARLLREFIRVRWFALPAIATFGALVAWMDPAAWRWSILATAVPVGVLFTVYEHRQVRRAAPLHPAIGHSLIFVVALQLAVSLATGGLVSPAVLASLIITFAAGVVGAPWPARIMAFGLQVAAFAAFAIIQTQDGLPRFIPTVFQGMARVGPAVGPWTTTAFLSCVAMVALVAGRRVGRTIEAAYVERILQREHTLALLRAHAQELTTLSSEVAHELKNPLASVKGLASLLAPHLHGRHSERMAVLQGEVIRMQTIMDELLTLTRPLLPLNRQTVDVAAIVTDVVELHAGLAVELGVHLERPQLVSTLLNCDPQKVRQILINLLQNALEATPHGEQVRVELDTNTHGVAIEVIDGGRGIDPDVADRIFERGVTTKATGSGIGLTVARTFARQHGGQLTVTSNGSAENGCRARLYLPNGEPASTEERFRASVPSASPPARASSTTGGRA